MPSLHPQRTDVVVGVDTHKHEHGAVALVGIGGRLGSHVLPFAAGSPPALSDGLLLRADIHKLHDRGYVTVAPDLTLWASGRAGEDFHNGRSYYGLDGRQIWTPDELWARPARDRLAVHRTAHVPGA